MHKPKSHISTPQNGAATTPGVHNIKIAQIIEVNSIPETRDYDYLNDSHKAMFLDFIRIATKSGYTHLARESFSSLFQLSKDIIEGKSVNLIINIGIGGTKESPSVLLPSYILGGLEILQHMQSTIVKHYENCVIHLRIHSAVTEAIQYNSFPIEDAMQHSMKSLYILRAFVKQFFPAIEHLVIFDAIELDNNMTNDINQIQELLSKSQDLDILQVLQKLEKMGEKHGGEAGKENAIKYAISHAFGLQDIPHNGGINSTSILKGENPYYVSIGGKAEMNFNLIRKFIREVYLGKKDEEGGSSGNKHIQLTSDRYLTPPYYQDPRGDISFESNLYTHVGVLSPNREIQKDLIISALGISWEQYIDFLERVNAHITTTPVSDIMGLIGDGDMLDFYNKITMNNTAKPIAIRQVDHSVDTAEGATAFLVALEQKIKDRGLLPPDFETKKDTPEGRFELISHGSQEMLGGADLLEKIKGGKNIIAKFGIDPTGDEIHIGHLIPLKKLLVIQKLGYSVRFLIGTFTATIGDPDKKTTRDVLGDEVIAHNIQTYLDQIGLIIDLSDSNTQVVYNKDWYGAWSAADLLGLAMKGKVGQMLQKEMFARRIKEGQSVAIGEFMYPLLQGWDSVILNADIEFGGQDQKFNLLMGRELQSKEGVIPQAVATFPLLNGFDGKKMSKTFQNYVGIKPNDDLQAKINDDYGKLLSMNDVQMIDYFTHVVSTTKAEQEILRQIQEMDLINPIYTKKMLARSILGLFYTEDQIRTATDTFERVIGKKETPDNLQIISITVAQREQNTIDILHYCLQEIGIADSKSEIRRKIDAGAIAYNGNKINMETNITENDGVVKYGKKLFFKLQLQ